MQALLVAMKKRQDDEAKLAAQGTLLNATFNSMIQGCAVYDTEMRVIHYNAPFEKLFDYPPGFLYPGISQKELIQYRAERGDYGRGDVDEIVNKRFERAKNFTAERSDERTLPTGTIYIHHRNPMPDGGHVTTYTDITERKQLEDQLHQSQKMETVGQLAGGIAHEYNNLLTVILSALDMLQKGDVDENTASTMLELSISASRRGAHLTKQLLAFSRKEMLRPKVIQANALVTGSASVLRATLGEEIDIKTTLAEDLEPIKVDPHLLENAILNVALNSRAAMPDGGTVTIATANIDLNDGLSGTDDGLPPGRYVALTITDTGRGMPPDVLEHAFEPFYTTREVGEGTGLGLSMVYGFTKQSGGYAVIESEEGKGTSVTLYFPAVDAVAVETKLQTKERVVPAPKGGSVLVVEDDGAVRASLVTMLTSLGYEVHEAEDGPAALKVLDQVSNIDLLLSDVVLPGGMSGNILATEARHRNASIKVLLTSGHPRERLVMEGKLEEKFDLLEKPYAAGELGERLKAVLEG